MNVSSFWVSNLPQQPFRGRCSKTDMHRAPTAGALRSARGPHTRTPHQPVDLAAHLPHLPSPSTVAKWPSQDLTPRETSCCCFFPRIRDELSGIGQKHFDPISKKSALSFRLPFTWERMLRSALTPMNTEPGTRLPSSDPTAVQAQPLILKHRRVSPS